MGVSGLSSAYELIFGEFRANNILLTNDLTTDKAHNEVSCLRRCIVAIILRLEIYKSQLIFKLFYYDVGRKENRTNPYASLANT